MHSRAAGYFQRQGLTLLELVVVLGILAVMSTMAVRSLAPLADQGRYEATQRMLNDLRKGIAGDALQRTVSGQTVVTGYIADTGRIPATASDLLVKPAAISTYALRNFDSDQNAVNDITLPSGWRGPYLQLGAGFSSVLDGWGRQPTMTSNASGMTLTSLGSDGDSVAPEDNYRADVALSIPLKDYTGDIVFRLFAIDSNTGTRINPSVPVGEQLGVHFYGVNAAGGVAGNIEQQMLPIDSIGTFEYRRSSTIHGLVAARGLQWKDVDGDKQLDPPDPVTGVQMETVSKKSYVHYIIVVPSSEVRVEMELR